MTGVPVLVDPGMRTVVVQGPNDFSVKIDYEEPVAGCTRQRWSDAA